MTGAKRANRGRRFRQRDDSRQAVLDRICVADEHGEGEPLLSQVLREGRRIGPSPSLPEIQRYCRREVAALPPELHRLDEGASAFPVLISDAVRRLATAVDAVN